MSDNRVKILNYEHKDKIGTIIGRYGESLLIVKLNDFKTPIVVTEKNIINID